MSAWRILTRALYRIGGTGKRCEFDDDKLAPTHGTALTHMRERGLATNNGKRGTGCVWTLTQLGIDYCEHRVEWVPLPGKEGQGGGIPRGFLPTWLSSLPRNTRMTPRPCVCLIP